MGIVIHWNGCKFYLDDMCKTLGKHAEEYHWNGVNKDDVLLDIGACIGSITIPLSKKIKYVYAVEPVMHKRLDANIKVNNCKNITVFDEIALSGGNGFLDIDWCGYKNRVRKATLSEIIQMCGCDKRPAVLKCDCEGGEKSIKSEELESFRIAEFEVHQDYEAFFEMLRKAEMSFTYEILNDTMIVHARRK